MSRQDEIDIYCKGSMRDEKRETILRTDEVHFYQAVCFLKCLKETVLCLKTMEVFLLCCLMFEASSQNELCTCGPRIRLFNIRNYLDTHA